MIVSGNDVAQLSPGYPSELDHCLTLPDRQHIRIRPLHDREEGPLRELFTHLSPRTCYLRFFSPFASVPDSIVRMLARVDYRRQLALLAEHEAGTSTDIIGLGSYGAVDDRSAEVSLVVRDDWQGRRVGTELAVSVLDAAEARGFCRFIAHVAPGNGAIRKLLRNVGDVVSAQVSGGFSEFAFVRRRSK